MITASTHFESKDMNNLLVSLLLTCTQINTEIPTVGIRLTFSNIQ